jgi:fatty-acyl-CoA synthase
VPDPDAQVHPKNIDLRNVVLIIGSEPVSVDAMEAFNRAFMPFGLSKAAFKPSYGIAEATLLVATIDTDAEARVAHFDRRELEAGRVVCVPATDPHAVAHVSCGHVARSQWATFGAVLRGRRAQPSHADGELFVTGRLADLINIDDRQLYPQRIEATAADASPMVRRGYAVAFSVPASAQHTSDRLVIVAERAPRTARADPQPALDAITAVVGSHHGVAVSDVRLVPAGAIPRTTSGKLARRACRAAYLAGSWGTSSV